MSVPETDITVASGDKYRISDSMKVGTFYLSTTERAGTDACLEINEDEALTLGVSLLKRVPNATVLLETEVPMSELRIGDISLQYGATVADVYTAANGKSYLRWSDVDEMTLIPNPGEWITIYRKAD